MIIIIGYSFGDVPINNAFIDMLSAREKKPKIIIVDPNSKEIIQEKLPSFRPFIVNVDRKFDDMSAIAAIDYALEHRVPGDIK